MLLKIVSNDTKYAVIITEIKATAIEYKTTSFLLGHFMFFITFFKNPKPLIIEIAAL